MRAVFFDRDGTLMHEVDHCHDPAHVRAISGAREALAELTAQGWQPVIITNQSGIGRGYFTEADYRAVNAELFRQLAREMPTYFCADHPDNPSLRRKPETGMVEEAAREHHLTVQGSWFVGDKEIDVLCGKRAGCRTVLVQTGYGAGAASGAADFVAADVVEAISIILRESALP